MRRRWATQAEMVSRLGTVPDVLNRALYSGVYGRLISIRDGQQARPAKDLPDAALNGRATWQVCARSDSL